MRHLNHEWVRLRRSRGAVASWGQVVRRVLTSALGAALAALFAVPAGAQLAATSNDGQNVYVNGRRLAPPAPARPSLFGTIAVPVATTRMDERWRRISARSLNPAALGRLISAAAPLGRQQQAAYVQTAVNRRITYRGDYDNWGFDDYWATAEQTLARGSGDCEDIAIVKYQALRRLGFAERDLYLTMGRAEGRGEHATLLVRVDGRFWVLDDRQPRPVAAEAFRSFEPMLTFGSGRAWLHGRSAAPAQIAGRAPMVSPAGGSN